MVAFFAVFHGHAHGTELPAGQSGLLYSVGFVTATGLLHATGIAIGLIHRWAWGRAALRMVGAAVAVSGDLSCGARWREENAPLSHSSLWGRGQGEGGALFRFCLPSAYGDLRPRCQPRAAHAHLATTGLGPVTTASPTCS